ncbi:DMT family transporter [Roseovarius faecimaris]|uniref:DMT family transporter n=1 Tax=Roseovarius faecimaris TaxID=2494550 RepID=A0A6I6IMJ3_9RHOB|nr:DMT family transporter [Roseovarius faecimaris]QGX98229.1 DMT family transporter [Roseovarius faecimaris]
MDNLRGILFILLAMLAFTIEDVFIKQLSSTIAVGQILLLIGVGSGAIFAVAALLRRKRLFARAAWRGPFLWRMLAEACAAMAFSTSLSLVDLSVVAAVFQATPLVITLGAALFLGEDVGWRRWSAILVGFCGVLLIIRPGLDGFQPEALLVVIAVLCVATRDLITRRMDVAVDSTVVSFQAFSALIVAGPLLLMATGGEYRPMTGHEQLMILGALIFSAIGYYGIVSGMRIGEASVVTPFRYTRLLFSIIAGILVFSERPDTLTLTGAVLIIATGLYTVLRERRLARRAALQA